MTETISYIRPGRTTNKDGVIQPTHLRVTYNLDIPAALALTVNTEREPGLERTDAEKEALVDTLLANGATYVDADETFMPGYVIGDAVTNTSTHWQFFKKNQSALYIHTMDDSKQSATAFGRETMRIENDTIVRMNRALSQNEIDAVIGMMKDTRDGQISLKAPLDAQSHLVI